MSLDLTRATATASQIWDDDIVTTLREYITIPNQSAAFDADWAANGHMDRAVELARRWCSARGLPGATVEVVRLEDRSPVLVIDVPASDGVDQSGNDDGVLLYGHLDKQPPMLPWRDGLGPWEPVLEGDRLYGRGGADDGYATFASMAAIEACRAGGGEHARCLVLIECSEESGSPDLPAYVDHLADRIGTPELVVCLDSFCGDYDRLWTTTSLRGNLIASMRVQVLSEGVHSGGAGGVVPDTFRLVRELLDRIEDPTTGRILVDDLHADIPSARLAEIDAVAGTASPPAEAQPWVGDAGPMADGTADQLRAKTWEPCVAYVGIDGLPPGDQAGNVLRPFTELRLSFRLPPTVDAKVAAEALTAVLSADPPEGATISVTVLTAESGWDAPPTAPWLAEAVEAASQATFGRPAAALGEGGTIPFMGMLGHRFPDAQFLLTGVLGPGSNAHGPNEFLHIPTGKRVTTAVAAALNAHARH